MTNITSPQKSNKTVVKPEPEKGTWLKSTLDQDVDEDMIVRVDEFKEWGVNAGMIATGINGFGDWKENHPFGTHYWRRATDEEVEQALVGFIHRAIQLN